MADITHLASTETLYAWRAKRSGNHMAIEHSTGKITGFVEICIYPNGMLYATHVSGKVYTLSKV